MDNLDKETVYSECNYPGQTVLDTSIIFIQ